MIKIKIKLLQQYRLIENFFTFPSHKEIISKLFHCDFTYVLSLYIIASQHLTVQGYDYRPSDADYFRCCIVQSYCCIVVVVTM